MWNQLKASKYRPNQLHSILAANDEDSDADSISRDIDEVHENLLCAILEAYVRSAATIAGDIILGEQIIALPAKEILFDSGANMRNYVSLEFFEKHKDILKPYWKPKKGFTSIANGTPVRTQGIVSLTLRFRDTEGDVYQITDDFDVFEDLTYTIIIGVHTITRKMLPLFFDMLSKAAIEEYGLQAMSPWQNSIPAIAPEELSCPDPSSFPFALHFMEMTFDEALEEYYGQIKNHVSPEFLATPGVDELLRTIGAEVFVPRNWEGINGIEPLELFW
jgi:hypothetical protein